MKYMKYDLSQEHISLIEKISYLKKGKITFT